MKKIDLSPTIAACSCAVCRRPLGEHDPAQLFLCAAAHALMARLREEVKK